MVPMLGFKRFFNARRVLGGVDLVHKIIKGQFDLPESFSAEPFQVKDPFKKPTIAITESNGERFAKSIAKLPESGRHNSVR